MSISDTAAFRLVHVVVHRLRLVVFQVGERRGLDADVETPRTVVAERYPREGHLPAVEVARDGDRRGRELPLLDVEAALEIDAGFGRDIQRAVEPDRLGDVLAVARRAVVDVGDRVVDRVVEAEVPRQREVVVALRHVLPPQHGVHVPVRVVEGVHVLRRDRRDVVHGRLGLVGARLEGVAERPARGDDTPREEELVVAFALGRDAVGVERRREVDAEVVEQRRAERDRDG